MKSIVAYLIFFVFTIGALWSFDARHMLPKWMEGYFLIYRCFLMGGLGGSIYCLRAVYINRSLKQAWDPNWTTWYFLRPFVSCLLGVVSYVFLKAGLLVLNAKHEAPSEAYGFLALAFIAGLNVDRFLNRIEETALSAWGVAPSRSYSKEQKKDQDKIS